MARLKSPRAKGSRAERRVEKALATVFGSENCWRGYQRISNHGVNDIETPVFAVEVKHRKSFDPYAVLSQCEKDAKPGKWPIAVVRHDNEPFTVVMKLDDFVELIEQYWAVVAR